MATDKEVVEFLENMVICDFDYNEIHIFYDPINREFTLARIVDIPDSVSETDNERTWTGKSLHEIVDKLNNREVEDEESFLYHKKMRLLMQLQHEITLDYNKKHYG